MAARLEQLSVYAVYNVPDYQTVCIMSYFRNQFPCTMFTLCENCSTAIIVHMLLGTNSFNEGPLSSEVIGPRGTDYFGPISSGDHLLCDRYMGGVDNVG